MAVAVDAVSSAETQSGVGVTTATHTNLTIGASLSNGALIVGVAWDTKVTSPTAHWDSTGTNQLMTLLGTVNTAGTNGTVAIFGLRNPTSGNKTFSTSWTTASLAAIFGISFTGVDQTSDAAAFKNFNSATGNSTAPSVAITSAVNDIVVGAFVNSNNATDWSSVNNTTLCVNAGIQLAMNRAAGAASVTMSGVLTSADQWGATGIDVAAVSAAVTDLRNMWFQPWREPVRRKTATDLEQRALAFVPVVVTPSPGPGATVAGADIAGPTFTKTFIYQAKAQTLLAKEDIPKQEWTAIWDEPVWPKRGLAAHEQQFLAWSGFTPSTATPTGWNDPLEVPVRNWQRSPIYSAQFLAWSPAPDAFGWFTPLSEPVRIVASPAKQQVLALAPNPIVATGWSVTLSEPVRVKQRAIADYAYAPLTVSEVITIDKWYNPLAPPVSSRRRAADFPWTFLEPAPQVFFPYAPWDDFVRRPPPPLDTQPLAWSTFTPAAVVTDATVASADIAGPTFTKSLIYQVTTQPINFTAAPVINAWSQWPDFAPRAKRAADFTPWTFVPLRKQIFLVSGATSVTIPLDWNNADNTVEAIGGGGGGGDANASVTLGYVSGGGGEYRKATNVFYTPGSTRTVQIGAGGLGATVPGNNGADGTASFIKDDGNSVNIVLANPGLGNATGGTGGVGAGANHDGGAGIPAGVGNGDGGLGGGGAGGPGGVGLGGANTGSASHNGGGGGGGTGTLGTAGSNSAAALNGAGGAGGQGGGGTGSGTAGTAGGGAGGNGTIGSGAGGGGGGGSNTVGGAGGAGATGTEWGLTHGAGGGGGGGGGGSTTSGPGGNGSLYGGGGGSGGTFATNVGANGGNGGDGIVVLSYTPTSPAVTLNIGWFGPLFDPAARPSKLVADLQPWTFVPPPAQVFFPYAPWDDFARRKQPPLDTQPLAWNSLQITTPAPIMAWVRWPDFAPRARPATDAPSSVFLALVPSATTVQDWADFVLRKPPPLDTQPLIWTSQNIAAPAPTMAWVRWPDFAPKKPVPLNYNPLALVQLASQVFFPYAPWDDFTRRKPQFPDTQPIAGPINFVVEITLVSKWFEGLSLPPGPKRGLGTYLQSSYTNDTMAAAIALFARARWYAPLSEPVRRKGLRPEFQKFTERDIFVANFYLASLNATEQGDFLFAVLSQFNTPISAYVDIVQNDPRQRGNLGVIENVAQSSIIASITEPQTVPATGQPVSTVAGARVAIIIQGAGP